jgi:hypothetical protein
VGIPEIRATAVTREEAVEQVRQLLGQWFDSGQLAEVEVPRPDLQREWKEWEKSDPEHQLFLEGIRRFREEQDQENVSGPPG